MDGVLRGMKTRSCRPMQAYESVTLRTEKFNILNLSDELGIMADAVRDCEEAGYNPIKVTIEPDKGNDALWSVAVLMRRKRVSYQEFLEGIIQKDTISQERVEKSEPASA